MNAPPEAPNEGDPMIRESRLRGLRHRRFQKEQEQSALRRLAQVGVLGWMIVTPALIGMFLGRWLDGAAGSGIFWTAPLLMIGLGLGCWSAWRWMGRA